MVVEVTTPNPTERDPSRVRFPHQSMNACRESGRLCACDFIDCENPATQVPQCGSRFFNEKEKTKILISKQIIFLADLPFSDNIQHGI